METGIAFATQKKRVSSSCNKSVEQLRNFEKKREEVKREKLLINKKENQKNLESTINCGNM